MDTRKQIEQEFDEKLEKLKRERKEALDEYDKKIEALRDPIDDDYWRKRGVLDSQRIIALREIGLDY